MKDKWTKENIPDLTGKTIIVTGGNSGLGYESVKAFAEKGAHVVLASRSLERGEKAKSEIGDQPGEIEVMQLDLGDFKSIEKFASDFKAKHNKVDVLMNNAGIMMTPYHTTNDGFEGQLGINHFGHFKLTGLLLDTIKSTPDSRIVNVSSSAHKWGSMDFDNLQFEKGGYSPMKSYGRSKIANLYFTYELQKKLQESESDTIAVAAHPGGSKTNLDRYMRKRILVKILMPIFGRLMMEQDQGALSQIRAAVDPDVKGAQYYGPHKNMRGWPVIVDSNELSKDKDIAQKFWEVSEEITGQKYAF